MIKNRILTKTKQKGTAQKMKKMVMELWKIAKMKKMAPLLN